MAADPEMQGAAAGADPGPLHEDTQWVRTAVFRAGVVHLFEQARLAAVVNIALAGLVAFILWGSAPAPWLVAWSGALIAVNVARIALVFAYWRTPSRTLRTWHARFVVGMLASTGLWGLAGPLFLPIVPPSEALALSLAIGGIVAGGLPLLGAILPLYLTHVAVALVPVIVTYVVLGSHTDILLAVMITLFAAAMAGSGRAYSRNLQQAHLSEARLDEANQALEWRATHDPLTGLWNRQRFEAELDHELERAARYHTPCSLIMLDIDHFKAINDEHGHDVGDRVLARLGRVLAGEVRGPDRVARWGGEEFMVLLPQTEPDAAAKTAERLRTRIARRTEDGSPGCTASLGVAACRGPDQRAAVLKRLDDALYRAKEAGRDQVQTLSEAEWARMADTAQTASD